MAKVLAVITIVVAVRTFVFETGYVSSESMQPSISQGNLIVIDHLKIDGIHQGDIVTATTPDNSSSVVKRIVALAGQTVEIYDGLLKIDGEYLHEDYIQKPIQGGMFYGPFEVPTGKVFLLGDNRIDSIDSRNFGAVEVESITGKVSAVLPLGLNTNED